jgi:hypothetical protein
MGGRNRGIRIGKRETEITKEEEGDNRGRRKRGREEREKGVRVQNSPGFDTCCW